MSLIFKHWLAATCAACMAVFVPVLSHFQKAPSATAHVTDAAAPIPAEVRAQYGRSPMAFEPNRGQTDPRVKFLSRGAGYSLFLTPTEAVFTLRPGSSTEGSKSARHERIEPTSSGPKPSAVVRMGLIGANPDPDMEGLVPRAGKSNYFRGNDPAKWQRDLSLYGRVKYRNVYPGVDVVYYGNQQQLEYDFIVAPGKDPKKIALGFKGIDGLRLDETGNLILKTAHGDITQHKPVVYQDVSGERRSVEGGYQLIADNQVAFNIGRYDATQPLVIDPVLAYSTYLGGSGIDGASSMAVDEAGNLYVTGSTESINFPAIKPLQTANRCANDIFIAKFNAEGNALVYSTYLGGSGEDYATAVALDSAGNAYIAGHTVSTDFPVIAALQATHSVDAGNPEVFVAKLNTAGNALVYSTYLGGNGADYAAGIDVDIAGNAYVAGDTDSSDFPLHAALQATFNGSRDGFVSKLNATGSTLIYSTYLGGSDYEAMRGLDVDPNGNAYVTGQTRSTDFPTVLALQAGYGGADDAFVTKLNAAGNALAYSTYLGGSGNDFGRDIAVDDAGFAFVVGTTGPNASSLLYDFPLMSPSQPIAGGLKEGFVSRLIPEGSALVYSTYLGGSGNDDIREVATDNRRNAYITGYTSSPDFPIKSASEMQSTFGGGEDAFVSRVRGDGQLAWSTYLGGAGYDNGYAIALYGPGNIYVSGNSDSTNFPTLFPFQAGIAGSTDAFIARLGGYGILSDTHDFDFDGKSDILWRNTSTGVNAIWKSANANTPQAITRITDQAWKIAGVFDFDDDGKSDILWRNTTNGANSIWRSGNSTTPKAVSRLPDQAWKVAGAGLGGGVQPAILWRNASTGANMIWPAANSAAAQAVMGVTNLAWQVAGFGGFDSDSNYDILWRNHSTGANVIWMSANSATQRAVTGVTSQDWQVAGLGDFYGDGISDILWHNSRTGASTIWRSGNAATQQPVTRVTNLDWNIAAVGDYNGDGRSDILWRNYRTGANVIWRSGNSASQQLVVGVTNLDWVIIP